MQLRDFHSTQETTDPAYADVAYTESGEEGKWQGRFYYSITTSFSGVAAARD